LLAQSSDIEKHLLAKEINWHLIPPRAPEHGGLWEAGVKSMEKHSYTVLQDANFNFEELTTVICKIEAILNSLQSVMIPMISLLSQLDTS
jgi:hypothetical protein